MSNASAPGGGSQAELRAQVDQQLLALDAEIVGLTTVKQDVRDLVHGLLRAGPRGPGSVSAPPHCAFSGPAGIGKTSIALRLARLLHLIGWLRAPRVHRVTRDELVSPFVGYTADKTGQVLREAAGGVLLVDKADELVRPGDGADHGREALDLVIDAMSRPGADLMVVIADEETRLEHLMTAAPRLESLTGHELVFSAYAREELLDIAEMALAAEGFRFDSAGHEAFAHRLRGEMAQPGFANVRTVRRGLDRARLRQARRIALYGAGGAGDMVTITAEDVLDVPGDHRPGRDRTAADS